MIVPLPNQDPDDEQSQQSPLPSAYGVEVPPFVAPPTLQPELMQDPRVLDLPYPQGGLKGALFGLFAGMAGKGVQALQQQQQAQQFNIRNEQQVSRFNTAARANADYQNKMALYKAQTDYTGDLLDIRTARANQDFRLRLAADDRQHELFMAVAKAPGKTQQYAVLNEGIKQGLISGETYANSSPQRIEQINAAQGMSGSEPIAEVAHTLDGFSRKRELGEGDMLQDNLTAINRLGLSKYQVRAAMAQRLTDTRLEVQNARLFLEALKDQYDIQTEQDWVAKLFKTDAKDSDNVLFTQPGKTISERRTLGSLKREKDLATEAIAIREAEERAYLYMLSEDEKEAIEVGTDKPEVGVDGLTAEEAMFGTTPSDSTATGY